MFTSPRSPKITNIKENSKCKSKKHNDNYLIIFIYKINMF